MTRKVELIVISSASDPCACMFVTDGLLAHRHSSAWFSHALCLSLELNNLPCCPDTNLPSLLIKRCPRGKGKRVSYHPVRPKHPLQTPVSFFCKASSPGLGGWRALPSCVVKSGAVGKHTQAPQYLNVSAHFHGATLLQGRAGKGQA